MRQSVRAPAEPRRVVSPPGDKSISHRAALLNSIAQGTGTSRTSASATTAPPCFVVCAGSEPSSAVIQGARSARRGVLRDTWQRPRGLSEPSSVLNAGNSGDHHEIGLRPAGGATILQRHLRRSLPQTKAMGRIVEPLTEMGASVTGRAGSSLAPLAIRGGDLQGIDYTLPVASAQLKSCILIAAFTPAARLPCASRRSHAITPSV